MKYTGYTLIELIIVIAIFGILFSVIIESFNTYMNHQEDIYAKTLASDLLWARFSSINEGVYYKIEFWSGYEEKEWEYRIIRGDDLKELKRISFGKMAHIINVNFPNWSNNLCFYPNGTPSSGGTITIKDKMGNIIFVKVEAVVGRIRVSR